MNERQLACRLFPGTRLRRPEATCYWVMYAPWAHRFLDLVWPDIREKE